MGKQTKPMKYHRQLYTYVCCIADEALVNTYIYGHFNIIHLYSPRNMVAHKKTNKSNKEEYVKRKFNEYDSSILLHKTTGILCGSVGHSVPGTGIKNRSTPSPGWMSLKANEPGFCSFMSVIS